MELDDLEKAPEFPLPEEFHIEHYKRGMEKEWVAIHKKADRLNEITEGLFYREFGGDEAALAERQLYLEAGDTTIGTASAWFDNKHKGGRWGRIHWVAITPEWQGKGLSKVLLSAACARLMELGHTKAFLSTNTARIPAVNLYLSFGFKPAVEGEDDLRAWKSICGKLRQPLELDGLM